MPELAFTIDSATGELTMQVRGVRGPACDDVARLVKTLLGEPAKERQTTEYSLGPRVHPQIRPRRHP